ncbi:MAG: hypothetical protein Q4F17_02345 [Eubacteriales bacterium]|nr:hypothetical protein [Eubacteriales bacterium]
MDTVLEFKCPCCNAGLTFSEGTQQMKCDYCDNTFDLETLREYADSEGRAPSEEVSWEESQSQSWNQEEQAALRSFQCPACGGEILADEVTAASFCPYCDNPTILPSRLSGSLRPDGVIPFQTGKEDAKAAFLKLCRGKPLLPREFTREQRLDRITGVYVPFWLYDCDGDYEGSYHATRIHRWADSRYNYTKTDHFLLRRGAEAGFAGIPMDGSTKADDVFMESIEPYDYTQLQDFEMAYLSGYLADKYDVPSENGEERIRQRVDNTLRDQLQASLIGYTTVLPTSRQLHVRNSRARYVLLPIWVLNTNYRGKLYTFVMNGQTGKMTGSFPACPRRTAAWFAGITAGVTVLTALVRMLF